MSTLNQFLGVPESNQNAGVPIDDFVSKDTPPVQAEGLSVDAFVGADIPQPDAPQVDNGIIEGVGKAIIRPIAQSGRGLLQLGLSAGRLQTAAYDKALSYLPDNAITSPVKDFNRGLGNAFETYQNAVTDVGQGQDQALAKSDVANLPVRQGYAYPRWWLENGTEVASQVGNQILTGMGAGMLLGAGKAAAVAGEVASKAPTAAQLMAFAAPTAASVYGQTYESAVNEMRAQGVPEEKIAPLAGAEATVNSIVEFGTEAAMGKILAAAPEKEAAKQFLRATLADYVKEAAKYGAKEGAQEAVTGSIQDFVTYARQRVAGVKADGAGKTWADFLDKRLTEFALGALPGGAIGAGHVYMQQAAAPAVNPEEQAAQALRESGLSVVPADMLNNATQAVAAKQGIRGQADTYGMPMVGDVYQFDQTDPNPGNPPQPTGPAPDLSIYTPSYENDDTVFTAEQATTDPTVAAIPRTQPAQTPPGVEPPSPQAAAPQPNINLPANPPPLPNNYPASAPAVSPAPPAPPTPAQRNQGATPAPAPPPSANAPAPTPTPPAKKQKPVKLPPSPITPPPGPPLPGRIQPDPLPGGIDKTLTEMQVDLGIPVDRTIRSGRLPKGLSGGYYPGSGRTVVRFAGDLNVAAHEVGHALDDQYKVADLGPGAHPMDAELQGLAVHGSYTPGGPVKDMRIEGLAEYIHAWLVNPAQAEKQFPLTSARVKAMVPAEKLAALRTFGDDVRRFYGASAEQQVRANIDIKGPDSGPMAAVKDFIKPEGHADFQTTARDRFAVNWLDAMRPVWKAWDVAKSLRGLTSIVPSKDAYILGRNFAGIGEKLEDIQKNGMIDAQGKRVTGGFEKLMEPLDRTSEATLKRDTDGVMVLAVAERVIEKSGQIDAGVAEIMRHLQAMEAARQQMPNATTPAQYQQLLQQYKTAKGNAKKAASSIGYQGALNTGAVMVWANGKKARLAGTGGGFFKDNVQAAQVISDLQADPTRYARLKQGVKAMRDWHDANLKYLLDKGRISQKTYDAVKNSNQYYVSFQRVMDTIAPDLRRNGHIGVSAQVLQRFKGSTRQIENPYVSLMMQTARIVQEADRNDVRRAFTELFILSRDMYQGVAIHLASIASRAMDGDPNTIKVYRDGKPEVWQFHPDIHRALMGMTEKDSGPLMQFMSTIPRLSRNLITHSPDFWIRNIVRDLIERFIYSDVGGKPTDALKGYTADELSAFKLAGGGQAGHYLISRSDWHKEYRRAIDAMRQDRNAIIATAGRLADAWNRFSRGSEYIGRVAEFKRAREYAKTQLGYGDYDADLYAAFKARDLMDFAVAGEWAKTINQLVPFSNAHIQGLRKLAAQARANPRRLLGRMVLATIPMAVAVASWARFSDSEEELWQQPAYLKDMFWNFKVGPNFWVRISKPFELGLPSSIAERMVAQIRGDTHAFEGFLTGKGSNIASQAVSGTLAKSFLPYDDSAILGPFSGAIQAASNYDWFRDRAIVPPNENELDLQYRHGTNRASRVGQVIQSLLGVDARKADFLIQAQAGGIGRLATQASDIGREDRDQTGALKTAAGLAVSSPGTISRDAQWVMDYARRQGQSQSTDVRPLQDAIDASYQATTQQERDDAARNVRDIASRLRAEIEAGSRLSEPVGRAQEPRGPHGFLWWAQPQEPTAAYDKAEAMLAAYNKQKAQQLEPAYRPQPPERTVKFRNQAIKLTQQEYGDYVARSNANLLRLLNNLELDTQNPTERDRMLLEKAIELSRGQAKIAIIKARRGEK